MSQGSLTLCKCGCGYDPARQDIRDWVEYVVGRGFRVNSVCRCPGHNAKVGGSPRSRHIAGDAIDLAYPLYSENNRNFFEMVLAAKPDTILIYNWGLHLDWRVGTKVGG